MLFNQTTNGSIIQFASTTSRNLVQILIALDRPALDGFPGSHCSTSSRAIAPSIGDAWAGATPSTTHVACSSHSTRTTVHVDTSTPSSVLATPSIIGAASALKPPPTATHRASTSSDRPAGRSTATIITRTSMPSTGTTTSGSGSGSDRTAGTTHHSRWKHGHGEAREVEHVVHRIRVQVESSRGSCRLLTVGRREMPVRVGVCARRRNMSRVNDISVDELKLFS